MRALLAAHLDCGGQPERIPVNPLWRSASASEPPASCAAFLPGAGRYATRSREGSSLLQPGPNGHFNLGGDGNAFGLAHAPHGGEQSPIQSERRSFFHFVSIGASIHQVNGRGLDEGAFSLIARRRWIQIPPPPPTFATGRFTATHSKAESRCTDPERWDASLSYASLTISPAGESCGSFG